MGHMAQISNIDLTCPGIPATITKIKGCVFTPAVYLTRGKLYLIFFTNKLPKQVQARAGFYNVPEKSYYAWIKEFKPVAVSAKSITGTYCYIAEAIEGQPPPNFVPTPGYIEGLGLQISEKIEVKPNKGLLIH